MIWHGEHDVAADLFIFKTGHRTVLCEGGFAAGDFLTELLQKKELKKISWDGWEHFEEKAPAEAG